MYFDAFHMVRGVPVHEMRAGIVDQPVREAAVRVRNLEAPIRAPMNRHDDHRAWAPPWIDGMAQATHFLIVERGHDVHTGPVPGCCPPRRHTGIDAAEREHQDAAALTAIDDCRPRRAGEITTGTPTCDAQAIE